MSRTSAGVIQVTDRFRLTALGSPNPYLADWFPGPLINNGPAQGVSVSFDTAWSYFARIKDINFSYNINTAAGNITGSGTVQTMRPIPATEQDLMNVTTFGPDLRNGSGDFGLSSYYINSYDDVNKTFEMGFVLAGSHLTSDSSVAGVVLSGVTVTVLGNSFDLYVEGGFAPATGNFDVTINSYWPYTSRAGVDARSGSTGTYLLSPRELIL